MTSEQFSYWLQGFSELVGSAPTKEQWKIIQDHLQLVFKKVTPNYNTPYHDNFLKERFLKEQQDKFPIDKAIC